MTLTNKQEKFAQLVASGLNHSDAYRQSYDASNSSNPTIWERAWECAHHSHVAARIEYLKSLRQQQQLKAWRWSEEKSMREVETNLTGAREDHEWPAANKAAEQAMKLSGHLLETRVDVNVSGNVTHALVSLSDEELRALVTAARLLAQQPGATGAVVEGELVPPAALPTGGDPQPDETATLLTGPDDDNRQQPDET